jgi:LAGLIDADG DNA endonuclease family
VLNEFYYKFYAPMEPSLEGGKKPGSKVIPLDLSLLTPIAIAHWTMQDGSRGTSKGLYLCTDSFIFAEVLRLSKYLNNEYNIKSSIHKSGGNYRIYILAKSVETVKILILPFMHKTMKYKLGV